MKAARILVQHLTRHSMIPLRHWHWSLPLGLLVLGTVLVWLTGADLALSRLFYDPAQPDPWPYGWAGGWSGFYKWGHLPSTVLALGSVLVLPLRPGGELRAHLRRLGLICLLSLLLGPMLLTNGVLKEFYGRPRPRQVEEFGGKRPFTLVLAPTFRRNENSFPSGHAAGAFGLMALYFGLRHRWRRLAWLALGGGFLYGLLMGYARIIQGGHFLSDILWSAGVVYFSALLCAWWVQHRENRRAGAAPPTVSDTRRSLWWGLALASFGLIFIAFVLRMPFRVYHETAVGLPEEVRQVEMAFFSDRGGFKTMPGKTGEALRLVTRITGRGLPWWNLVPEFNSGEQSPAGSDGKDASHPGPAKFSYTLRPNAVFAVYDTDTTAVLPPGLSLEIKRHKLPR